MTDFEKYRKEIDNTGFTIINNVFTNAEVDRIVLLIESSKKDSQNFRQSKEVFAIRQFFKEVPEVIEHVIGEALKNIVSKTFGNNYFVVKSIYFDKPADSNWFVSWHQDLTISVKKKFDIDGYGPWTVKQNQFAVQPPLGILEDNFTVRIHLDSTDKENGALRIIPCSHKRGIIRPNKTGLIVNKEKVCEVDKGGIMVMKPLLMHFSGRTINNQRRRVVHIEFSKAELPHPLQWSEKILFNKMADKN